MAAMPDCTAMAYLLEGGTGACQPTHRRRTHLRSADVGGGLVAADVLLAGLQHGRRAGHAAVEHPAVQVHSQPARARRAALPAPQPAVRQPRRIGIQLRTCMAMRSAGAPVASREMPIMRPGSRRLYSSWQARKAAWGPP